MGWHLGRGVGLEKSGGKKKEFKRRRVPGGLSQQRVEEEVGRS